MVMHICNPSTRRQRKEDHVFKARMGYIVRSPFQKKKKNQT
jgi:hypothetical protein